MGSLGLGNGSLRMDDVFLEGTTPDGPAVVGHLSVIVDTEGITFLGPEPGDRRTVGWDRMSPLEFGPPDALPDGMAVTSLEFQLDGRPLRLLVPAKAGPTGDAGAQASASSPDVAVRLASDLAGPVAVVPEAPPVVELPFVPPEAAVAVVPEAPPVVEPPFVPSEAAVAVVPEAPPVVEPPFVPAPADVASASPVVESPAPLTVASPSQVVESPAPPAIATPVPVVESPAPPAVATPAPVVEPPFVPVPAPTAVASALPVVESPAPEVVALSVPEVESTAPDFMVDEFAMTSPPVEEPPTDDFDWSLPPPRATHPSSAARFPRAPSSFRPRRRLRLILLAVLAALIPLAVGVWYARPQPGAGNARARTLSDSKIADRVGIQPGDLPNWSANAPRMGNVFAAGATSNGAAGLRTAVQASSGMAGCLRVPISAVEGAFGMGNAISQRTAEVTSPSYADPGGNGGAVNSVVDVVKTPQIERADSNVFANPSLFATCYQPYVQAMLPYAKGVGAGGFATATVQPIVVPMPTGPSDLDVAAFQIARIANDPGQTATVVTTAVAVFGGRVQATLGTVSNFVFSIDAQNQLVHDLEVRTIGVSQL